MPRSVPPSPLTEVSDALTAVRARLADVEEDLHSCLVVMGEPDAQRAVDGWVDQVVDLMRAVDEMTEHHLSTLSRVTARRGIAQDGAVGADAISPVGAFVAEDLR